MIGHIVFTRYDGPLHQCQPPRAPQGVQVSIGVPCDGLGGIYPLPADYWSAGTVWRCDCGCTWVGDGVVWRREGRYARWRRERPERKEQRRLIREYQQSARVGGCVVLDDVHIAPEDGLPPSAALKPPTGDPE